MSRVYNFNAGPATLPEDVLKAAQGELLDFQDSGMSIMEASHRSATYNAIHQEAIDNISKLLDLPEDYTVLFMTGGASSQFAFVPLNLLATDQTADYVNSGRWASKAIDEAQKIGLINVVADTASEIPTRVPSPKDLDLSAEAAYLHITSNETVSGAQWKEFPTPPEGVPLVADMSSDILSRKIDVSKFGLIYAGAQKNLAPAGVTLVIMRKELADRAPESLPTMFRYKTHLEKNSLYNTPPTFPIYMLALVTRKLLLKGGLDKIEEQNKNKAQAIYGLIDGSEFYTGAAVPECRSNMNITFRLPSEDLEAKFIGEAADEGLCGLKGHRSVGGVRASIYNAFPLDGISKLIDFMDSFQKANS